VGPTSQCLLSVAGACLSVPSLHLASTRPTPDSVPTVKDRANVAVRTDFVPGSATSRPTTVARTPPLPLTGKLPPQLPCPASTTFAHPSSLPCAASRRPPRSRRPSAKAVEANIGDKWSLAWAIPTDTSPSTTPTWCTSPTRQPAAIDHERLPPHQFSSVLCAAERTTADDLLHLSSGASFVSPSSSVAPWHSPATSAAFLASPPVCRREVPSVESPQRGALPQ
jgi:hypothetical protein